MRSAEIWTRDAMRRERCCSTLRCCLRPPIGPAYATEVVSIAIAIATSTCLRQNILQHTDRESGCLWNETSNHITITSLYTLLVEAHPRIAKVSLISQTANCQRRASMLATATRNRESRTLLRHSLCGTSHPPKSSHITPSTSRSPRLLPTHPVPFTASSIHRLIRYHCT